MGEPPFAASYASPVLRRTGTAVELVATVAGEIPALDPDDGRLLWRHEHANRMRTFPSGPVLGDDGLLFASAGFSAASARASEKTAHRPQSCGRSRPRPRLRTRPPRSRG